MIKGITVLLHVREQTGTDAFGAPTYKDGTEPVENVLVSPVTTNDVVGKLQISGKRAEYELCIPKGDANTWENRVVEFFGRKWRTIGLPQEYIADLLPLAWNRKVRVERYE